MIGLASENDRLLLAKSLLAQEFPMAVVAHQVALPTRRLRREAVRRGWLRRSRRDAYSTELRAEVLREYARTGSRGTVARMFGVGRTTVLRWIHAARPFAVPPPIRWKCYDCEPVYGRPVEGSSCLGCGAIRKFGIEEDLARTMDPMEYDRATQENSC